MLKVYEEQMERLVPLRLDVFVEGMRPRLREAYPERTAPMSNADLDRAIEAGNQAALGHGLSRERDIERFVYLRFALGDDFDREAPWADVLGRADWSGQTRVDLLCALHEGRLWDGPDDAPFSP